MKKVIIIFILWMLIINIFAICFSNRLNLKGDTAYDWIDHSKFYQTNEWNLSSLHARWDSFWYLDIAQNGYIYKGVEQLSNIVFFPLYPILIKIFSVFTFGDLIWSGWIMSSFFLLLSLIYLYKLVKEFHPELDPYLSIIFLLIFPTAFFLNAIYTESLFLLLSLVTFYYGLKNNFVLSGFLGLLASLTRVTGVLLFIPILWEYFKRHKLSFNSLLKIDLLSILLIPAGIFSFFLYHYIKFGDLLLFLKVESWWGRSFEINQSHFSLFSNPAIINFCLDVFFVVFALTVTYFVFRKLRVSYALYMLATLGVALSTGTFMSIGRYILVLFPVYILAASIKKYHLQQAWIFTSTLLLALYTLLFVSNYWAG